MWFVCISLFARHASHHFLQSLCIKVHSPDTHITDIVPIALGIDLSRKAVHTPVATTSRRAPRPTSSAPSTPQLAHRWLSHFDTSSAPPSHPAYFPFGDSTRSFAYGLQRSIQIFSPVASRKTPSVADGL